MLLPADTNFCLLYDATMQAVRLSDFGTPGADLSGIYYLRNVADADAMLAGVQKAKAAGNKVGHNTPLLGTSRGFCAGEQSTDQSALQRANSHVH